MRVLHDYRVAKRSSLRESVLAIGNFDGLHIGHREILSQVVQQARAHQREAMVFTFEPHPTRVLAPERASPLLTGLDRRLELLEETGVDAVIVQGFDRDFSSQSPTEFVQSVLAGLCARHVFVGEDFRFGQGRAGNGELLSELGKTFGFQTTIVAPINADGAPCSSSRVRRALAQGDLAAVRVMLGRNFDMDGLVVHGDHRGRTIGFPTANIRTRVEALPMDGVYAVRFSRLEAADGVRWNGVMNIGVRPTFAAGRSIEVHLLDAPEGVDLYHQSVRVECVARLRDEKKFSGLDALRMQIEKDVLDARVVLGMEKG